jgi:hypothetical protein
VVWKEKRRLGGQAAVCPPPQPDDWQPATGSSGGFQGINLPGQAGNLAGRSTPVQNAFAGYPGDNGHSFLQRSLSLNSIILPQGLADVPHQVTDAGLGPLVAQSSLFILAGPFHGGKMSGQSQILLKNYLLNFSQIS